MSRKKEISRVSECTTSYEVSVGDRGRLVLPAAVRKRLNIEENDRLVLVVDDDGSIRLMDIRTQIKNSRGMLKKISTNRNLVDELIKDRRTEAEHE